MCRLVSIYLVWCQYTWFGVYILGLVTIYLVWCQYTWFGVNKCHWHLFGDQRHKPLVSLDTRFKVWWQRDLFDIISGAILTSGYTPKQCHCSDNSVSKCFVSDYHHVNYIMLPSLEPRSTRQHRSNEHCIYGNRQIIAPVTIMHWAKKKKYYVALKWEIWNFGSVGRYNNNT